MIGIQLGVFADDVEVLEGMAERLTDIGTASVLDTKLEASTILTACDAVVIFADGYDEARVRSELRRLDARGAHVILVSCELGTWAAQQTRHCLVVHRAIWEWRLLNAIRCHRVGLELPFAE
jgi:hypothetical protein